MSQLLREFLSAWIEWVDAGAAANDPFERGYGLCSNLHKWALQNCTGPYSQVKALVAELKETFVSDGLDDSYPFCSEWQYGEEVDTDTMHLNPARIQWVRSKVAQFEVV